MRRQFRLPEADELYLDTLVLNWETVVEGTVQWLVVHEWPLPVGYNYAKAMAALVIPPGYSDAPLDMVYFFPHLARSDGGQIKGLTPRAFDGKDWQQWSRHRTPENPWRPGEDDIAGHFILVDHWLRRELPGRAA
jgi:Prokaryotic E2 family E